jgi:hypothetical protein
MSSVKQDSDICKLINLSIFLLHLNYNMFKFEILYRGELELKEHV